MSGSRARTSASQACGSTSFILAVTIKEYMKAARSPPRGDPAKSQAFRPRATLRSARSAALLVRLMRPSSRKRVQRHADPVVPQHLDQVTLAPPEAEDLATVRIATQALLDLQRQAVPRTACLSPRLQSTRVPPPERRLCAVQHRKQPRQNGRVNSRRNHEVPAIHQCDRDCDGIGDLQLCRR